MYPNISLNGTCAHDLDTGRVLHGLDHPTTRVDVADHLTHVLLGRPDLDGHDGLEQHRSARLMPSLKTIEPAILNAISEESTSW